MRRFLAAVGLVLLLCLAFWGCGGDSNPAATGNAPAQGAANAALNPPDSSSSAAVRGFVVGPQARGTSRAGLQVVDTPSRAPGQVIVPGAQVRLVSRPDGQTVAETLTGVDGSFSLTGLQLTHAALEVREEPSAASPDFRLPLTLVWGKTLLAGAPVTVTRARAVDLAAAAGLAPDTALVVCTQNPLPAGTQVFPSFGNESGVGPTDADVHNVGANGEWFLMVDTDPYRAFTHDLGYVFVDAETGALQFGTQFHWPALNQVMIWTTSDLIRLGVDPTAFLEDTAPDLSQARILEDVVRAPDPDPSLETELSSREYGSQAPFEAMRHSMDPMADIPPEDRFAYLWVGSAESWFVSDCKKMYNWCISNGIPKENITVVLYTPPLLPGQASLPVTFVNLTLFSSNDEIVTASRAAMADLAIKVKARRDGGGHPCVFVFATSHGSPEGGLMVLDNRVLGLGSKLLGGNLYFPAEQVVPVDILPACKLRILLSCCRGRSHSLRLSRGLLAKTDADFAIYTASGRQFATGIALETRLLKGLTDLSNLTGSGEFVNLKPGIFFVKKWVEGATLSGQFEAGLSGTLSGLLASFSKLEDLEAYNDPMRTRDDSTAFDPGRPDPCLLPPDQPVVPDPFTAIQVSPGSLSVDHTVGVSPCPTLVGTVTLRNNGNEEADFTVTVLNGPALVVDAPLVFSLLPGQQVQKQVQFDCSTQTSFVATLRVRAQGLMSGQVQQEDVSVTVNIF